jgi:hypothetical protein
VKREGRTFSRYSWYLTLKIPDMRYCQHVKSVFACLHIMSTTVSNFVDNCKISLWYSLWEKLFGVLVCIVCVLGPFILLRKNRIGRPKMSECGKILNINTVISPSSETEKQQHNNNNNRSQETKLSFVQFYFKNLTSFCHV